MSGIFTSLLVQLHLLLQVSPSNISQSKPNYVPPSGTNIMHFQMQSAIHAIVPQHFAEVNSPKIEWHSVAGMKCTIFGVFVLLKMRLKWKSVWRDTSIISVEPKLNAKRIVLWTVPRSIMFSWVCSRYKWFVILSEARIFGVNHLQNY